MPRTRLRFVLVLLLSGCAAPLPPAGSPTPAELARLRSVAERGRSPDAQLAWGLALRAAGQQDSARAVLERALAGQPRNAAAALFLGLSAEEAGAYGRAAEAYRRYLENGRSAALKAEVRRRLPLLQRKELAAAVREAVAREAALSATPPEPGTVGVFPFVYSGGDPQLAPLTRALSSLLTTDLSQTQRLRVLERTQVQALVDEIALSGSALVDSSSALRAGRLLRAGRIVQGRIGGTEEALRIAAAVVPTGAPGTSAPVQVEDAIARLFDMEKRLALDLYGVLGVQLTVAERERVTRRATLNLQALLEFGWGLEAEDAGRFGEAAGRYARAAALDPGFAEAARRARAARELAEAAGTTTAELAAAARAELLALPGPGLRLPGIPDEPVPLVGLNKVRALLPDPITRDAGPELLGMDGLAVPGFLLIILQRQ